MIVEIKFSGAKNDPGDEYQEYCKICVDGKIVASLGNMAECPEDANLMRDFSFIYNLPKFLKAAYDAGKNGESFEIKEIENEEY
jgi:hypothetical protein